MRTINLYLRSASLILVLCCLSLSGCAQSGAAVDSFARAYESGLEMLESTSLTNGEMLEHIRKLFEQSDTYALGAEYLSYVNALIVLQIGNENRYDEALDSIRRLQKSEKFNTDYNSRFNQSNRLALIDLEQYIKARKLEEFGDTEGALELYDAYRVLDAVNRANLLSISLKLDKYEEATALLMKGSFDSIQEAADIFKVLGDFRDSPQRLQESQGRMEILATIAARTRLPEPTVQLLASLSVSASSGIVNLRWTSVNGADWYRIYRAESPQGSMKPLITLQGTEYSDNSVKAGRTYDYKVTAIKGSQELALTVSAQAEIPSPTQKPIIKPTATLKPTTKPKPTKKPTPKPTESVSKISNLSLTPRSATSIDVSWREQSSGSYQYTISYKPVNAKKFDTISSSLKSITIYDLAPNTSYRVDVGALGGNSVSKTIFVPEAEKYREYGYRWQQCRVYWINEGADFFAGDDNRAEKINVLNMKTQLNLRDYCFYLRFTVAETKEDKNLPFLLVLRVSNGDTYIDKTEMLLKKDWTSAHCYIYLDNLLSRIGSDYQNYPLGTYEIEVYISGKFAGRTSIKVE